MCSKCKSAKYCSREHQIEHWKIHKKLCGKTADELNALSTSTGGVSNSTGSGDGVSVVVPMDGQSPLGSEFRYATMTNADTGKMNTRNVDETARNIHGDKKFLVKVCNSIEFVIVYYDMVCACKILFCRDLMEYLIYGIICSLDSAAI